MPLPMLRVMSDITSLKSECKALNSADICNQYSTISSHVVASTQTLHHRQHRCHYDNNGNNKTFIHNIILTVIFRWSWVSKLTSWFPSPFVPNLHLKRKHFTASLTPSHHHRRRPVSMVGKEHSRGLRSEVPQLEPEAEPSLSTLK